VVYTYPKQEMLPPITKKANRGSEKGAKKFVNGAGFLRGSLVLINAFPAARRPREMNPHTRSVHSNPRLSSMRWIAIGHSVPPSPEPVMATAIAKARRRANQWDGTDTTTLKISAEAMPKSMPWHSRNW